MADYLEAYAAHFELPVRSGTTVDTLAKEGDRYVVTAGDDEFEADNVVVATGVMQKPYVPSFAPRARPADHAAPLERLPQPLPAAGGRRARRRCEPLGVGHRLRGRRGARDDPLGSQTTGRFPVRVDTRRGRMGFRVLAFAGKHIFTMDTPIGRKMRPHIRHGGAPLLRYRRKDLLAAGVERTLARTVGVEEGRPVLDDGRVLDVRNVVWCTGFRPDFSWIDVPFEVGDDGYPVQYRGVVDSAPGLYFVGTPVPALVHVDAGLRTGQGRRAGREAHRLAAREPARCTAPARRRSPSRSHREQDRGSAAKRGGADPTLAPRLERARDEDPAGQRREAEEERSEDDVSARRRASAEERQGVRVA